MAEYTTVFEYACDEFTEKKSRFIGHISHAETEEEALAFINEIRSKYRDATHNVFAYVLRKDNTQRASDDSEPSGTAGVPVLNVIKGEDLTDCVVVVTRYFGGTLLGTGGLVKAYTEGAKIAVSASKKVIMAKSTDILLETDYDLYGKIEHYLQNEGTTVLESSFGEKVTVIVRVKEENRDKFTDDIREITSARAACTVLSSGWNQIG